MAADARRVDVGKGGCWYEKHRCDAPVVPGGYFCAEHVRESWSFGQPEGGGTGEVLIARAPDTHPDLEGPVGRSVWND